MTNRLLETKFHTPLWRSEGVIRQRLLDQLQAGLSEQRKLTLVSAPAGYGKTTLITSWLHFLKETTPNIWLSLGSSDDHPARFLAYWITSWNRVCDFKLEPLLDLLDAPQLPPFQNIIDEVINALANLKEPVVLVLDDYHVITTRLIHEMVDYFIEHQPHQAHMVIITRSDPPFPLPRLRARGQMVEIRAGDLRFIVEEADHFFNQSMNLMLKDEYVHSLEMLTEGWAVGLHLAGLALKNLPNTQAFVETFRGSHRYVLDYLAEEVIHQQREEVREFLIQTSILERFNAASCEAITGYSNCQDLILELEQANLFLIPLDDDRIWYRYHHLFADFLRTELSKTETKDIYKKAAIWHEQNGLISEAVQYAIASDDVEFLADLVDRGLRDDAVWSGGDLTLYAAWLDALSLEAYQGRPLLSLNASHILYLLGQFDLAEKQIDLAEQTLDTMPASTEKDQMIALASLYRGTIAAVRGDTIQAIEKITFAQDRLPQEHHLQHARGFFSLGLAYEVSGKMELAVQNYLKSSEEAQRVGVLSLTIHALGAAAQVQISQGQLHLAEQVCRQAIEIAGDRGIPSLGLVEIILGNIALERNDLAAADKFLQEGIVLSRRGGLLDNVILGLSYLARIYAYQERVSDAFEISREMKEIVQGFGIERLLMLAAAYHANLQLYTGQDHAARQWAMEYQENRANLSHEYADLTLVHVLLKTDGSESVPAILAGLLEQGQAQGHIRICIEVMILMALFHRAENNNSAAVDWLSQALELAEPNGFIRVFLDEGGVLVELLPKAKQAAPQFVDDILKNLKVETGQSLIEQLPEPLSEQEVRVLRLIVAGKTNKEIADELVISVGTAKWHVHNILQKLGVSNRTQAIVQARELGL